MDTTTKKNNLAKKKTTSATLILMIIVTMFFLIGFTSNYKRNYSEANKSFYLKKYNSIGGNKIKSLALINNKFQNQTHKPFLFNRIKPNPSSNNIKKNLNEDITLERVVYEKTPPLADGMVMVTPNFAAYKIVVPSNTKSQIISIPYDQSLIPVGYQVSDIRTYRYDETAKKWEELQKEGIDPEKNLLYSRTHADGVMINGIIKSPELPQTETYTPTKIKDLKLADPGAMVQLIEPPVANQKGSANLNYHIEIPKGRQGMQPDLNITYSSDVTNGLLGEGWDMHIPVISVETRWGVPQYESSTESETYLLNGEMLAFENGNGTDLAHRNPSKILRTSDRLFFTRKQTDYYTIIRHGNLPKNYWWEIIDNKGTKFHYGRGKQKYNDVLEQDIPESRLTDQQGNIAEWKLTRVIDVFGNCMEFHYSKERVLLANLSIENNYIDFIEYTGYDVQPPLNDYNYNYKLNFVMRDNSNFNYSARYGFLTGNIKLLESVHIDLNVPNDNNVSDFLKNGKRVRSYKFDYTVNNSFGKPLLTKLTQFGTDGTTEFNHHSFEYYDDVKEKGLFSSATWKSQSESLQGGIIPNGILPNTEPTDLGGSKSNGKGFSFYAGVGINDGQICNKSNTFGVQFGFNSSDSEGLNTLIDIDGDGLPDKVFVKGNELLYSKNIVTGFSDQTHPIGGRSQFFEESSSTNSFGVSSYFGPAISRDKISTETDITTYFADVNADGLVDIVADGSVHFNHIDANGIPSFTDSSNGTFQPITGGQINVTDTTDYPKKKKELALQNPQHDVIRVWEAPFTGTINIIAPVQLLPPSLTTERERRKFNDKADGVIITVQKSGSELERIIIFKDDYTLHPINKNNIAVNAGDKIYFRVMSGNTNLSNADFDKVNWTPEIIYTSDNGNPINTTKRRFDVFGENLYEYNVGKDFLFTNEAGIYSDDNRTVKIAMPFQKDSTSNDIRIQIVQLSENLSDPIIRNGFHVEEGGKKLFHFTKDTLLFDKLVNKEIISNSICNNNLIELAMSKESIYQFKILSDVNTDFKKISWQPYIYFYNQNRRKNDTIFIVPNYQVRDSLKQRSNLYSYPKSGVTTTNNPPFIVSNIYPFLKFQTDSIANDNIWFTIRKGKTIVGKYNLKYDKGKLINYAGDVDQFELNAGEDLYATFESDKAFKNKGEIEEANWEIGKYSSFFGKIDNFGNNSNSFISKHKGSYILTHNLAFKTIQTQSVQYSILLNGNTIKKGVIEFNQQQEQKKWLKDTIQLNANDIITVNYENINPPETIPATSPRSIVETTEIDVSMVLLADLWYKRSDEKFGPMYRNWGQFAYNDNKDGTKRVIVESELKKLNISYLRSNDIRSNINNQLNPANKNDPDIKNLSELNNKNAVFNILIPFRTLKEYQWKGMDDEIFINQTLQSSSRVGLKDVNVESPFKNTNTSIGKASGIVKRTSSKNVSTNVSMVIGASISNGTSKVESDYLDLNGDRFPDIISSTDAQLTLPNGTLGSNRMSSIYHNSGNKSFGMQIGGSTSKSFSSNTETNSKVSPSSSNNIAQNGSGAGSSSNQATSGFGGPSSPTIGSDWTNDTWLDVNGDGLPDKLHKNGAVEFNLGKLFSPTVNISDLSPVSNGSNYSISPGGYGFNNGNSSISGGLGISLSRSLPEEILQDINGDGLVDKIKLNDNDVIFYINEGSGFSEVKGGIKLNQGSISSSMPVLGSVINKWNTSFSASAGNSLSGTFTFGFFFGPIIPIFKAVFSPGINKTTGLGTTLRQFYDINGDGYPDYLFSEKEGDLQIQLSNISRTNKLKNVSRPLGGKFKIDYVHNEATYEHPGGKWIMDSLTIDDGVREDRLIDKGFDYKKSFQYKKGKYDRYEREFLGFGEIIINDLDFAGKLIRKQVQTFDNKNYYTANNLITDRIEDLNDNKYIETVNEYWHFPNAIGDKTKQEEHNQNIAEFDSRVYSCPLKYSANNAYEGLTQKLILNESYFEYNELANNTLFRYSNKGDLKISDFKIYDYETVKKFDPIKPNKIFGLLTDYSAHNKNRVFREGGAEYNPNGTLKSETVKLDSLVKATTKYEYDEFGNIIEKIFPNNFWEKYTHESQLKTYITQVGNKHLYNNRIEYDYKFGKPVQTFDINNMVTKFELDPLYGRIIKVWSPNEINAPGSPPIIEIKYDSISNTGIAHSTVSHFAVDYDNNPVDKIITHTYIDGNKRVIQSKKTALISNNQGVEDNVNNWIGSGKIIYDALGRKVQEFHPIADSNEKLNLDKKPKALPTVTTYDVLDRLLSVTMPPVNTPYISYNYGISENMLKVTSTLHNNDPLLNVITSDYFNGNENKVRTELNHNNAIIKTHYEYDVIHQLKKVIDDANHITTKEYDLTGRLYESTNPDGGKNKFEYDNVGNIVKKILPDGSTIEYLYNHDQLTDIIYPKNIQNNVKYFYGKLGTDSKTFGRVYYKEDATGAEKFEYDFFGNISKIEKTIIAPFDKLYTFNTEFKYDSWNRIHKIKYPDNSEIKYLYNKAGLLDNIIENDTKKYVSKIGYDEFEQRRYIKYGNGSESKYDYDERRRLTDLNITFNGGSSINTYKYDNLNNIINNSNKSNPGNGLVKSDVKNDYSYNDNGQLKTADGSWDPKTTYSIKPVYDSRLNLVTNNQLMKANNLNSETNLSYKINDINNRIDYVKETKNRFHDPSKNIDKHYVENNMHSYEYDEKGNNTIVSTSDTDTNRKNVNRKELLYDEDNRISAVNLNGLVSNYFYDDKGERIIKMSTQTDNVFVNGLLSAEKTIASSFSLYVNPYFSTRNGMQDDSKYLYTKHIYIGSQRIASELAAITNNSQPLLCDQQISDKCSREAANFPSKKTALENKVNEAYGEFGLQHQTIKTDEFKKKIPLIYKEEVNPDGSGMKIPLNNDAGLSYYYHTNQINSVNYVSDITGKAVQHIEYLPYGQVFMENRQGYSSQFTFSDKEEDRESGLTYFGARYYNSKVALWQSVDPMTDKYPGMSPYNYCLGNPINFIDEKGNDVKTSENYNIIKTNNLFLTFYSHYRFGTGTPLHIDSESVNLPGITSKNIVTTPGKHPPLAEFSVNTFDAGLFSFTGIALGKIGVTPMGNNKYSIEDDEYDFGMEGSNLFTKRNITTYLGGLVNEYQAENFATPDLRIEPKSFKIIFHGEITIPEK